jgi:hypothetical protein
MKVDPLKTLQNFAECYNDNVKNFDTQSRILPKIYSCTLRFPSTTFFGASANCDLYLC